MVDLAKSETQSMLQASARQLFDARYPLAAIRAMDDDPGGVSPALWREMRELGWPGLAIPAELGGQGGSLLDLALLYEEFGRACLPLPLFSSAVLCGQAILEAGSDEDRARFVPGIASGEARWAFAFTEREYGWGPDDIQLPARSDGASWRLTGTKFAIPYAEGADWLLVPARTSARPAGGGLSLFAVAGNAAGLQRRNLSGWQGDTIAEVTFDNTPGQAIGGIDEAWGPLGRVLDRATAVLTTYIAGASQKVFELTAAYGRSRIQFGVPIGSFQRVQDRTIEIVNAADAARWTSYEAIWRLEQDREDSGEAVALAKMVASQGFIKGMEEAHHVYAGYGADRNLGLWLYTRKARSLFHYLGDPAHHRARIAHELDL